VQLRQVLALALAAGLSLVAAYLVAGQRFARGPVLVQISEEHGAHLSDLGVAGLWAIGIGICAVLWRGPADRG
jgi:hypothetical protein